MALDKKLQDAIKESMPEMVGKELRAMLEEGETAIDRVLALEVSLDDKNTHIDRLRTEVSALKVQLSQHAELSTRENKLAERERLLDLELLKVKLECADRRHVDFMGLMTTVFKNPVVKRSVVESGTTSVFPSGSSYPQSLPSGSSRNEVEEQD